MSTSQDQLQQFAPVYDYIPEQWEEARGFITEAMRETANVTNANVKGYFLDEETLSGKLWTPRARASADDPIVYRNVFRKVVDLGGLNDFSTTSPQTVAHGIDTTEDTFIVALYGAASDPGASTLTAGIPLPFVEITNAAPITVTNIELRMDATNIILESGTDYSAYTRAWVVVEYVQEA